MILLDTNVVSEPLKPRPDPHVLAWIDSQAIEVLHLPSTALAEWLTGVERMTQSRRRSELKALIEDLLAMLIGPRFLTFDSEAARRHSKLMAHAAAKGKVVSFADCQIAAIATVHGLTVATRDVAPFISMDVPYINPWDASKR
jgi:predicted nucleic acid-binding protein